ncbi:MAG: hypothetical protein U9R17_02290 [Thermodesulfobacteriota bacterium]|nr:hypothetical protein [Thermodesulfobacteriota bacterium]
MRGPTPRNPRNPVNDQKSFDTPESIGRLEESTENFLTKYELIGSETPAHLAERLANSDLSWNKKCVILDIISSLRIICLDETIISIAKEKWMNLNIDTNQDLLEHSFNTLGIICGIEMIPKFFDLAKDAIVSCYGHERKEKFHMTFAAIRGIHRSMLRHKASQEHFDTLSNWIKMFRPSVREEIMQHVKSGLEPQQIESLRLVYGNNRTYTDDVLSLQEFESFLGQIMHECNPKITLQDLQNIDDQLDEVDRAIKNQDLDNQ